MHWNRATRSLLWRPISSVFAAHIVRLRCLVCRRRWAHHNCLVFGSCRPFGQNMIAEQAEPWLTMLSGVLVTLLAVRMFLRLRMGSHNHKHHHGHDHHHHHGHSHDHGHMGRERQVKDGASATDIVWFGFSGGLLPCPAAIAVLLVCIQIKQFTLGVAMVAAFSVGLAATLVVIGLTASWMSKKASTAWPWLDRIAHRLPYLSAGI